MGFVRLYGQKIQILNWIPFVFVAFKFYFGQYLLTEKNITKKHYYKLAFSDLKLNTASIYEFIFFHLMNYCLIKRIIRNVMFHDLRNVILL